MTGVVPEMKNAPLQERIQCWCNVGATLVPGSGIEPERLAARDFESRASTCSAIPATQAADYALFR